MSKIETMRRSGSLVPQLEVLQSISDLQRLLGNLNPTEIEKTAKIVRESAANYGELMAQELVTASEALMRQIQQAKDTSSALDGWATEAALQLQRSVKELAKVTAALELIQEDWIEPRPKKAKSWPFLIIVMQGVTIVALSTMLATVLLRG